MASEWKGKDELQFRVSIVDLEEGKKKEPFCALNLWLIEFNSSILLDKTDLNHRPLAVAVEWSTHYRNLLKQNWFLVKRWTRSTLFYLPSWPLQAKRNHRKDLIHRRRPFLSCHATNNPNRVWTQSLAAWVATAMWAAPSPPLTPSWATIARASLKTSKSLNRTRSDAPRTCPNNTFPSCCTPSRGAWIAYASRTRRRPNNFWPPPSACIKRRNTSMIATESWSSACTRSSLQTTRRRFHLFAGEWCRCNIFILTLLLRLVLVGMQWILHTQKVLPGRGSRQGAVQPKGNGNRWRTHGIDQLQCTQLLLWWIRGRFG